MRKLDVENDSADISYWYVTCAELPKLVDAPGVEVITCTQLGLSWSPWSPSSDIGDDTLNISSYTSVYTTCLHSAVQNINIIIIIIITERLGLDIGATKRFRNIASERFFVLGLIQKLDILLGLVCPVHAFFQ